MICQRCQQSINHAIGDMVVRVRVQGVSTKWVFCLGCADELVISKLEESE